MTTYNGEKTTVQRDEKEMQWAMKQIRMRAGIPDFKESVYKNVPTFRLQLKRERMIEFIGENAFRYYDLRRWKDALAEENTPIMGCNINYTNDNASAQNYYKPVVITSIPKSFLQRMYLWPFEAGEFTRNIRLTQNPGW